MINTMIIGFGPFAKSCYFNYIKENNDKVELKVIIDLKSQKRNIESFLISNNLDSIKVILLEDAELVSEKITKSAQDEIINAIKEHNITNSIISTEPKSHYKYLELLVRHSQSILLDKPIVCGFNKFSNRINPNQIIKEFKNIEKLLSKNSGSKIIVNSQRRFHAGFEMVQDELNKVINDYKLPVLLVVSRFKKSN